MKRIAAAALLVATSVPVIGLAPAAAGGGGCFLDAASDRRTTTITIDHVCFEPTIARVPVGAAVTWRNDFGLEHNLTGPVVIEYADLTGAGATVVRTFTKPGIYPFACTFHPGMSGVVVVGSVTGVPAAAAAAVPAAAVPPKEHTPLTAVSSASDDAGSSAGWVVGGLAVIVATALVVLGFRRRRSPAELSLPVRV